MKKIRKDSQHPKDQAVAGGTCKATACCCYCERLRCREAACCGPACCVTPAE